MSRPMEEKDEVSRPISTILDDSNYLLWSQHIKSFLIGRKLWRIVTRDIVKPEQVKRNPTTNISTVLKNGRVKITKSSLGSVQDFQMGHILGTGSKVGRLFELTKLHLPTSPKLSSAVSSPSVYQ
ncbi:hypothetical protein Scep_003921 [Stephania cephalantha]|uniref:Retrotransposon Copia-like N-terminal domain-containing protein n=1 Tax=Stephania cephalantha TaxID=152367 RepID=A0AAP0KRF7_9MAGN